MNIHEVLDLALAAYERGTNEGARVAYDSFDFPTDSTGCCGGACESSQPEGVELPDTGPPVTFILNGTPYDGTTAVGPDEPETTDYVEADAIYLEALGRRMERVETLLTLFFENFGLEIEENV